MTAPSWIPAWLEPAVTPAERAVADFIARRFGVTDPLLLACAALTVLAQRGGHACVDLRRVAELVSDQLDSDVDVAQLGSVPSADAMTAALRGSSALVYEAREASDDVLDEAKTLQRPFVLMGSLLYTQRQFVDELSIALQVGARTGDTAAAAVDPGLIERFVPKPSPGDDVAMRCGDDGIANRAATSFVTRHFTVLTGGPGTGKTYTLTRCLAALLDARADAPRAPVVAVAAPTGKAAARAGELIASFVEEQRKAGGESICSAEVLEQLGRIEPRTIHGLLGSRNRKRTRFAHDAERPLGIDVLVVDETSMVPSWLMARLLEAVRPDATILLVGDQGQLEAVESGSVLREIVASGSEPGPHGSWVFELVRVWRQEEGSDIGDLARAIRAGRVDEAVAILGGARNGVAVHETAGQLGEGDGPIGPYLDVLRSARRLAEERDGSSHRRALELVSRSKVLCGPRMGRLGIGYWNATIGSLVLGRTASDAPDPGTPLLVTVNSPRTGLVNGDIGIVVNSGAERGDPVRSVYFSDGTSGRYVPLAQMPPAEPCFAMTIHKSQGSEYENVVLVLPRIGSPLLNRELVYTAVTRAKKSLTIIGNGGQLAAAIENRSERFSALGTMITPGPQRRG